MYSVYYHFPFHIYSGQPKKRIEGWGGGYQEPLFRQGIHHSSSSHKGKLKAGNIPHPIFQLLDIYTGSPPDIYSTELAMGPAGKRPATLSFPW